MLTGDKNPLGKRSAVIVGNQVLVGGKDDRFLRPRPAIYLWLTNAISLEYDKLLSNNRKARITLLI